jgi:dihydropyrimidinase
MTSRMTFVPEWAGSAPRGREPDGGPCFLPDWAAARTEEGKREAFSSRGAFVPEWAKGSAKTASHGGRASGGVDRALLIKGGHCVVPYAGIVTQDILITGGRIAAIGRDIAAEGRDVIRAEGKYVLPGLIDPHVHLGIFAPLSDEISSETGSALANGVTTTGVYLGGQGSYVSALDGLVELVKQSSKTDVFVHLVLFNETQIKEVPLYAAKYGVRSFKIYMAGIPGLIPSADEGLMLDAMEAVAALGEGAVLNVHAENSRVLEWADARAKRDFPEGGLRAWEAGRPAFAEREAVQRALLLAERSGARLYFVHISSAEAAGLIRRAKAESPGRFYAETTSPYLSVDYDSPQNELAVMSPPIRSGEDRRALWEAVADGTIDVVGTDHTPLTVAQKTEGRGFWETMPGYPAVGTHLPLLLDGARRNRLGIERLVEAVTANPAHIFGLYPRKGTILPGSDADLVIVDLDRKKRISVEGARSRADFALHQGDTSMGWPIAVVKGGHALYPDDPSLDLESFSGSSYLRRL